MLSWRSTSWPSQTKLALEQTLPSLGKSYMLMRVWMPKQCTQDQQNAPPLRSTPSHRVAQPLVVNTTTQRLVIKATT